MTHCFHYHFQGEIDEISKIRRNLLPKKKEKEKEEDELTWVTIDSTNELQRDLLA